jgi:hypothetical protein
MRIASVFFIALLALITYGNPILVGWVWVRRLSNPDNQAPKTWRRISLWVGLSACTVAVGAFWLGLFTAPHTYPQEDIHFRRFLTFDAIAATLGIVAAMAGQGKSRWLVVLSGLGVGVGWFFVAVMT